MPVRADYHLHSHHSGDSSAPMEDQVRAALSAGLTAVCFTEHLDMDWPYEATPDLSPGTFDLDMEAYRKECRALQKAYAGRIEIGFGVELGLQPHLGQALSSFIKENSDLDFVLGSTHISRGKDPYYPSFFEGMRPEEVLRTYFKDSLRSLEAFHDIDSYAHMDYVVRYGPFKEPGYRYEDYRDVIDPILFLLLKEGIALEVNTAALSKGCRDMNPCRGILERYRELGGTRITIGSDAHRPANTAGNFEEACRRLKALGFTGCLTFRGRRERFLGF